VSLPPESMKVGKCYLTDAGQVRRILHILPNGRVAYERRPAHRPDGPWQEANQDLSMFAALAEAEVPCDFGLSSVG
jgi:hypothetical protein